MEILKQKRGHRRVFLFFSKISVVTPWVHDFGCVNSFVFFVERGRYVLMRPAVKSSTRERKRWLGAAGDGGVAKNSTRVLVGGGSIFFPEGGGGGGRGSIFLVVISRLDVPFWTNSNTYCTAVDVNVNVMHLNLNSNRTKENETS